MIELNKIQTSEQLNRKTLSIFYFYTPLCGTCKMATTILKAISPFLQNKSIYSCNVNIMPNIARELEIKSVPCLLVIENSKIYEEVYAFRSAANILTILSKYIKP